MTRKKRALGVVVALVSALSVSACGLSPVPIEKPIQESQVQEKDSVNATQAPSANMSDMATESGAQGMVPQSDVYVPQDFNTEEYSSVEEQGYVSTRANPLSTVSADVDTASYGNLRRMLYDGWRPAKDEGQTTQPEGQTTQPDVAEVTDDYSYYYGTGDKTIPKGAVRIEEMLNYFDYDYAGPKGDEKFGITARMGKCPWNQDSELLVLGFATAKEDPAIREKGSNLVFLIDVSGSMKSAEKLPLLQGAFAKLVEKLGPNDVISIVTYSGSEKVVLDGAKGDQQRDIMSAIRELEAGGSTNGEAGLRMAYDLAKKHFIEGGVNRIVMASDGDLNVGMSSESDLHDFVEKQRETGTYLSVLGFGKGNYKDTKMETLADHGNGSYHYIDSEQEAERVFGDRLTANLVPFANDVKVQVEFNPAQIKGYRLVGYENRKLNAEDFKDDTKDAGEVGPSSQFTVVYEVVTNDSAMDIPTPELKYEDQAKDGNSTDWLTAKIRYKPQDGSDVAEQALAVGKDSWLEDPGADWRFASAVTEFGMLLRNSKYRGTADYNSVRGLVGQTEDPLRAEFLKLVDMAEQN